MKALFLFLTTCLSASALFGQQWSILNPPTNLFNNTIYSTIVDKSGKVYASGSFTDSSNHNAVAVLSNGIWTELGVGGNPLHGLSTIYTLALDSSDNLYAAGVTEEAGGNYSIAKWNGSQWSNLGTGAYGQNLPGMIFSLATDKAGNIYAGGELMDSTGNYYISKWDGQSWTEIGTGTHALHANGIIYSIIPDANGNIYTAGQFTNAAGKFYVAKWNGTDWSEVGSGAGVLNANSNINSLIIDAVGNLYAAGDFKDISGYQYVAAWNGNSWKELGTGNSALHANGMINAIVLDAEGRINAGGMFNDSSASFFLAQWTGNNWIEVQGTNLIWPVTNFIYSLSCDRSGNLFAAGKFTDLNGDYYVAKFSGSGWTKPGLGGTKLPHQSNPMQAMAVDTGGHVFAVLGIPDMLGIPMVERWNGKTWIQLPDTSSIGYASISHLAADSSGNMYASGIFGATPGVGLFNGVGWTAIPMSTSAYTINAITNLATDKKGNVYICGQFLQNGVGLYNMAKWDGTSWNFFYIDADLYYFIVDSAGTIYSANADYTNTGYNVYQIKDNLATRIGGTDPNRLNANSWVQAMALDAAGNLYAGGGFNDVNGNAYVTRWDGNSWTELGGTGSGSFGASGYIEALAFDRNGNLFASGDLLKNSGTYIGMWDGQSWITVGDGQTFWEQLTGDFLCRDGHGTIYSGVSNSIYKYTESTPTVICSGSPAISLSANQTSFSGQTGTLVIKANLTSSVGNNTTFEFASDRAFNSILSGPSADSSLSLPVSSLQTGVNMVYVKMQTTDACQTEFIVLDSIGVTKNSITGLTDIDYPNSPIISFPNPFVNFIHISGLNASKTYTFTLFNSQGVKVKEVQVSMQTEVDIESAELQNGVYLLQVYDNTKNRVIGTMTLLK